MTAWTRATPPPQAVGQRANTTCFGRQARPYLVNLEHICAVIVQLGRQMFDGYLMAATLHGGSLGIAATICGGTDV